MSFIPLARALRFLRLTFLSWIHSVSDTRRGTRGDWHQWSSCAVVAVKSESSTCDLLLMPAERYLANPYWRGLTADAADLRDVNPTPGM